MRANRAIARISDSNFENVTVLDELRTAYVRKSRKVSYKHTKRTYAHTHTHTEKTNTNTNTHTQHTRNTVQATRPVVLVKLLQDKCHIDTYKRAALLRKYNPPAQCHSAHKLASIDRACNARMGTPNTKQNSG